MSGLAEKALIGHLVDADSIRVIAHEGVEEHLLPTPELRPILRFAINYFFRSGTEKAPSVASLRADFGDILDDAEIDLEVEPDESVEWAIDDLKAAWVHRQAATFNKDFATEMAEAEKIDRIAVLNDFGSRLVSIGLSLESRAYRADLREASEGILRDALGRIASKADFRGMTLGLEPINQHTYGVHEGELAVLAAGPKVGKSFFQCWVALQEWRRGRTVCLFTLENSVDMMLNRIACMAFGIDTRRWEQGDVEEHELDRVREWVEIAQQSDSPLWVLKPDLGQRSFEHMVREAELRGARTLLIDQLTHVEVGQGIHDRRPKTEKIGDSLHVLKAMISTGRHPMSCLLTHQINREGVRSADKTGFLEMYHLAESAEVERTADFIFGLYQSRSELGVGQAKFQMLGARRVPTKDWQIFWRPSVGGIKVSHEIDVNQLAESANTSGQE